MSTELSGIQAFSFYDPATGDTVQVGQKYVESFNFTQERGAAGSSTSPTGADVGGGDLSELEVTFTAMAGTPLLEQWHADDTPISFVAAGEQAAIQWYETDRITELESLPVFEEHGDLNRYRALLVREGHGTHEIYKSTNLLRVVNHGLSSTYLKQSWQDSDNNGIADGYTTSNASNPAFASNEQSFDTASGGGNSFLRTLNRFVFPISDVDLTLSAEHIAVHSSETDAIEAQSYDFSGSSLQTDTTTFSTTGRHKVTISTPSSIYEMAIRPHLVVSSSSTETVTVKHPSLRLDGSISHVNY